LGVGLVLLGSRFFLKKKKTRDPEIAGLVEMVEFFFFFASFYGIGIGGVFFPALFGFGGGGSGFLGYVFVGSCLFFLFLFQV